MASPAPLSVENAYRRVSLPMISVAPRGSSVATVVRASATMFGDDAREKFAMAVFLYVEGELVWEVEVPELDYFHPAEIGIPDGGSAGEVGLVFMYATRRAYLDGTLKPRVPRFEESWVFLVSKDTGDIAVSVPAVPYIGSHKKGIDHKYQCFAGLRLSPGEWRSTAYVLNPYSDPMDARCWLQGPGGLVTELPALRLGPRSVRTVDLLDAAAVTGNPRRFDRGTLITWGSLKPQGYVAIQGPDGRTRAMDHFNPFWA